MAEFPHSETDILDLCQQMMDGYTAHAADFPSVTVDIQGELGAAKASYLGNKTNQEQAKADAKVATANKDETLDMLVAKMRNILKLSEIDCTDDPEKLAYIGWGTRDLPNEQAYPPPQPDSLKITAEGSTDIWLTWEQEQKATVRHWVVESRRQLTPGGDFSEWGFAGTSITTEAHVEGQPSGVKLEYRVRAENNVAMSEPSNSVFAVL